MSETLAGYQEIKARHTTNGAAGDHLSPLPFFNPATLAGLPVPMQEWVVTYWVPAARVTGLFGPPGEGKTTIGQMLATASAIGDTWLGLPVRQCNSLLVFCEDDIGEMHRRQDNINRHYGCNYTDLSAIRWLPRLGDSNALMTAAGEVSPLFHQILAGAKEHDAKLILIDTLSDVFVGNENDRSQARAFAQQALGRLARETRAAVVVLAHPSRNGMSSGSGDSGSTGWQGTFRSHLYLATPTAEEGEQVDADVRLLTRKKANAARRNETIELRWQDGVFVTTAAPTGIIGSIQRRTCERVFMDLLDAVAGEGRYVSESTRAPNFAPKLFAARPDSERFKKADFTRAMQALFAQREIKIGTYKGANRHEHDCIVRA